MAATAPPTGKRSLDPYDYAPGPYTLRIRPQYRPNDPTTVYYGTNQGFFKSTDDGNHLGPGHHPPLQLHPACGLWKQCHLCRHLWGRRLEIGQQRFDLDSDGDPESHLGDQPHLDPDPHGYGNDDPSGFPHLLPLALPNLPAEPQA